MNIINEFFVSFILIKLYFKFKVCRKIKFPLLWKFYFSKWKFYFSADTIEGVDIVDDSHIVIENDNNFPYSSSREPNKTDDNEFILLEGKDFLKSK